MLRHRIRQPISLHRLFFSGLLRLFRDCPKNRRLRFSCFQFQQIHAWHLCQRYLLRASTRLPASLIFSSVTIKLIFDAKIKKIYDWDLMISFADLKNREFDDFIQGFNCSDVACNVCNKLKYHKFCS